MMPPLTRRYNKPGGSLTNDVYALDMLWQCNSLRQADCLRLIGAEYVRLGHRASISLVDILAKSARSSGLVACGSPYGVGDGVLLRHAGAFEVIGEANAWHESTCNEFRWCV
jgi:hypothetical protein